MPEVGHHELRGEREREKCHGMVSQLVVCKYGNIRSSLKSSTKMISLISSGGLRHKTLQGGRAGAREGGREGGEGESVHLAELI